MHWWAIPRSTFTCRVLLDSPFCAARSGRRAVAVGKLACWQGQLRANNGYHPLPLSALRGAKHDLLKICKTNTIHARACNMYKLNCPAREKMFSDVCILYTYENLVSLQNTNIGIYCIDNFKFDSTHLIKFLFHFIKDICYTIYRILAILYAVKLVNSCSRSHIA